MKWRIGVSLTGFYNWGSITGESVEKLIYKANRERYKHILVAVFLNQLPDKKRDYLKSISEVTTYLPATDPSPSLQMAIPFQQKLEPFKSHVSVHFIQDFPLICYESDYECNICALIKDLGDYPIPGPILENYTRTRRDSLSIRPREVTNDQPPFDFYDSPTKTILLDQEFILRMFEFKHLLSNANNSTYWRFMVKQELLNVIRDIVRPLKNERIGEPEMEIWNIVLNECRNVLAKNKSFFPAMEPSAALPDYDIDDTQSRSHAIIYFLSLETTWIQKPPLALNEIRHMLTLIAKGIIFNGSLRIQKNDRGTDKNIDVIRIKYAAITILRMADKKEFVKQIAAILNNTEINDAGSDSVIENILFHINTFISKDYHANHFELDDLHRQLDKVEDLFRERHTNYPWIRDAIWYLISNSSNLSIKGQLKKLQKWKIVENCKKIINEGIENIRYNHPELIQSFRNLELAGAHTDYFMASFEKQWAYVSGFIRNIFGVHFNEIKSVLNSEWVYNKGGLYIRLYLLNKSFGINDPFSVLIHQIKESNGLCIKQTSFQEAYTEQYKIILDLFISEPRFNGKKSFIIDILDGIKGKISSPISSAAKKYTGKVKVAYSAADFSFAVFYPQDLLDSLIEHIFENADEKKEGNKKPEISFLRIAERENAEYVFITIITTNTNRRKKGKGTGLLKHNENLPRFFGEIHYNEAEEHDEPFQIDLKFLKYE